LYKWEWKGTRAAEGGAGRPSETHLNKERTLKVLLTAVAVMLVAGTFGHGFAADPEIEKIIRKAYECAVTGDMEGVTKCSHPEIAKYRGTFDTGYSPGRSGSLGELFAFAIGVDDGSEKVTVTNLKVEVVKIEGEKAIAWATYHIVDDYESQLESSKGEWQKDEWDAKDYIILKKHKGEWRLRRLEDRAGHFLDVELQNPINEWGGVE